MYRQHDSDSSGTRHGSKKRKINNWSLIRMEVKSRINGDVDLRSWCPGLTVMSKHHSCQRSGPGCARRILPGYALYKTDKRRRISCCEGKSMLSSLKQLHGRRRDGHRSVRWDGAIGHHCQSAIRIYMSSKSWYSGSVKFSTHLSSIGHHILLCWHILTNNVLHPYNNSKIKKLINYFPTSCYIINWLYSHQHWWS